MATTKLVYKQARNTLKKAAPKGHKLAYITPVEAEMLKDAGGW